MWLVITLRRELMSEGHRLESSSEAKKNGIVLDGVIHMRCDIKKKRGLLGFTGMTFMKHVLVSEVTTRFKMTRGDQITDVFKKLAAYAS